MNETPEAGRAFPKDDLPLIEDIQSGLIRNAASDPSMMDYDSAYQNEQGTSQKFQHHPNKVAQLIARKMGKSKLVEVGCGKGTFL